MSLILFEDEHLLAVNKPAGWNTHAPSPFAGEGVYDWLRHREPRWARLAIIHRLDKETSGVLVFGKSVEANRSLTEQFTSRAARKKYFLLTDRHVDFQRETCRSVLIRAGEKYVSQTVHAAGERAETHFSSRGSMASDKRLTMIEAEPVTGRTHQIRVHAAERGFPILGDTLYGGTAAARVYLHAAELSLKHPVTSEQLAFRAPCEWDAASTFAAPHTIRAAIIETKETNALRLIHGASDGWPGFYVEQLGDFLLAQSEGALRESELADLEMLARDHHARGVYQKLLNRNVRRVGAAESSPQLLFGEAAPERFTILENGLRFELSFAEGYSVGLFLDQRDNRRRFLTNHVAAQFALSPNGSDRAEVLNCFSYTCGFSVAAAQAGARTTSLDLSRKYLEWGKRNFALNQLDPAQHDFIYGDAFDWMRRLAKKGRTFDCVILDPPTFSQSKESGTWQAEKQYGRLVEAALPLLKAGGVLFASTNAAKLEPEEFLDAIVQAAKQHGRKITQQHYVPQPPDFPISRAEPGYLKTAWTRIN
jgi:23S rRNA (cytosine1962-C5)-methyltransferase